MFGKKPTEETVKRDIERTQEDLAEGNIKGAQKDMSKTNKDI